MNGDFENQNKTVSVLADHFERSLNDLASQVRSISSVVDSLRNSSGYNKNELMASTVQLDNDLNELKQDFLVRFKNLDKVISNNYVKRY